MAACGEIYWGLLRTDSGHTPDDPWFLLPGPIDYTEWKAVAERITDRVWEALEKLGKIEGELGRGFPKYNEHNDAAADVYNRRNSLPHPLFAAPAEQASRALELAKDAACVLEQIDAEIVAYGRKPTHGLGTPKPTTAGALQTVGTVLVLASLGAALYFLARRDPEDSLGTLELGE